MIQLSQIDVVLAVLAVLAGMGVAMYVILQRRKWVEFRKKCNVIEDVFKEEGLYLGAEIMESLHNGDFVELRQEVDHLFKLCSDRDAFRAHLDKLFDFQFEKRLADAGYRQEIFEKVDSWREHEALKRQKIIEEAKNADILEQHSS